MKFFQQSFTLRRDVRSWTFFHAGLPSRPHHSLRPTLRFRQPATSPFVFQTAPPAVVAFPSGLLRELKMKGDD
jgi:hypothetical protein